MDLGPILVNRIRCRRCNTLIESRHVHDFVWCDCQAVAIDGGREYLRRVGEPDDIEELSETAHLHALAQDYAQLLATIEHGAFDTDERQQLSAERDVLCDQIVTEFDRLGSVFRDRAAAAEQALAIAGRFRRSDMSSPLLSP
jgi:hypothetical protein